MRRLLSVGFATALAGCAPSRTGDLLANLDFGGAVTSLESLGEYGAGDAVQMLGLRSPSRPLETTNGFSLFRVHYRTHAYDGAEVQVTGLMAVPERVAVKGVVSWQHGTNTSRQRSISSPSDDGIGVAALFAGDGYVVLAPDYIGLGRSYDLHPYYHVPSTVNSVVDFIRVGAVVLDGLASGPPRALFLTGHSQGGGASAAVHRALEAVEPSGLELRGSAPIAGAFNLRQLSLPHALHHESSSSVLYFCYLINSYSIIYDRPLSAFVREPYAAAIPQWFDGSKDGPFLADHLPTRIADVVTDEFFASLEADDGNWLMEALDENEMYRWVPRAPVRFYFGSSDVDVVPDESSSAYEWMKARGGNVELRPVGPFDHGETPLEALPEIQAWFNELVKT